MSSYDVTVKRIDSALLRKQIEAVEQGIFALNDQNKAKNAELLEGVQNLLEAMSDIIDGYGGGRADLGSAVKSVPVNKSNG